MNLTFRKPRDESLERNEEHKKKLNIKASQEKIIRKWRSGSVS